MIARETRARRSARAVGRSGVHGGADRRRLPGSDPRDRPLGAARATSTRSRSSASGRCAIRSCGRPSRRDEPDELDFSWHDKRLGRLRDLGIEVIAGLVHHGCGPHYTNLLDPEFPRPCSPTMRGASRERYPWIRWTPVNEPLTTARFILPLRPLVSAPARTSTRVPGDRQPVPGDQPSLCGRSGRSARMPSWSPRRTSAKTFATPDLQYQADHENERRWLTFDLLPAGWCRAISSSAGCATRRPPRRSSKSSRAATATPDIIGVRPLSHQRALSRPSHRPLSRRRLGCNGRHHYVDVEAVRVGKLTTAGPADRLREVVGTISGSRWRSPRSTTAVPAKSRCAGSRRCGMPPRASASEGPTFVP